MRIFFVHNVQTKFTYFIHICTPMYFTVQNLITNMDIWLHRETLLKWIRKYTLGFAILCTTCRETCMYTCIYADTEIYSCTCLYLCKYRNTVADWAMLTVDSHNYCRAPPRHATIWSLWAGHQVEVRSVFVFFLISNFLILPNILPLLLSDDPSVLDTMWKYTL